MAARAESDFRIGSARFLSVRWFPSSPQESAADKPTKETLPVQKEASIAREYRSISACVCVCVCVCAKGIERCIRGKRDFRGRARAGASGTRQGVEAGNDRRWYFPYIEAARPRIWRYMFIHRAPVHYPHDNIGWWELLVSRDTHHLICGPASCHHPPPPTGLYTHVSLCVYVQLCARRRLRSRVEMQLTRLFFSFAPPPAPVCFHYEFAILKISPAAFCMQISRRISPRGILSSVL